MVKVAEKAKAAVWSARSRRAVRSRSASAVRRLPARLAGAASEALAGYDLVVVIGAPVFTFHVEGHAAIFDGATTIFQVTDDPTAAAVSPSGTSIVATMSRR